jgi:hypothetical protein
VPWSAKASRVASGSVLTVFGTDQLVDVQRVRVGLVLGRRRSPQRALDSCAARRERLPTRPGECLEEQLVGELALRNGRGAAQRQRVVGADGVETSIDLGRRLG